MVALVLLFFKGKAGASASTVAAPGDTVQSYGGDALDNLAQAVFQFEGGKPGNINVRNNNPGNLRGGPNQIGIRGAGGYAVFQDQGDGWDALNGWITRHAQTNPGWDFYDLFSVYAPKSDHNDPDAYAEYVANYMGVDPSQTVSSVLWGG